MNRSLKGIRFFTIPKKMCLTTLYDESNPPLKEVQLMVSKVFMFHDNTELLPSGDFFELSTGNNNPTNFITIVLAGIPARNQLSWVKVEKEHQA